VSLRDEIAHRLWALVDDQWYEGKYQSEADAILALVRAHLTSDEAKVLAMSAAWKAYEAEQGRPPEGADAMFMAVCAAILAALGEGE